MGDAGWNSCRLVQLDATLLLLSIYNSDAKSARNGGRNDPVALFFFFGTCAELRSFWGNSGSATQFGPRSPNATDGWTVGFGPYLAGQLGHLGGQSDVWAVGQRTSAAGLLAGLLAVADLTGREQTCVLCFQS